MSSMPSRVPPVALPISSILPPSSTKNYNARSDPLPSPSCALLGPLPATTPLHLALNYLSLVDLPDYEPSAPSTSDQASVGIEEKLRKLSISGRPRRVIIVTGPRPLWASDLEDQDEDYLRDHGADYDLLDKLNRIDIRYCPTPSHLLLLLSTLTADALPSFGNEEAHRLASPPGLVVLHDVARLFMTPPERDENLPPGIDEELDDRWQFKKGTTISDYLNAMSAARAAQSHLSSLGSDAVQLVMLEPHLSSISSLPILSSSLTSDDRPKLPTPTREKRIDLKVGLEWLFGLNAVGVIEEDAPDPDADPDDGSSYTLSLPSYPDEKFRMSKRHCQRASYARSTPVQVEGEKFVEPDKGGWRWHWGVP